VSNVLRGRVDHGDVTYTTVNLINMDLFATNVTILLRILVVPGLILIPRPVIKRFRTFYQCL